MLCVSNLQHWACSALGLLLKRGQPKRSTFHTSSPNPYMGKLLAPYIMAPIMSGAISSPICLAAGWPHHLDDRCVLEVQGLRVP